MLLCFNPLDLLICEENIQIYPITLFNPNNNNPISSPGGIVNPDENMLDRYTYALINNNDNIKLKTELGEELLINIDEKDWKDIKWSTEGDNVAVLGQTKPDIYHFPVQA